MYTQQVQACNYSQLSNARFTKTGNLLVIEADIHIDGDMIASNQRLEITPVLLGESDSLELPILLVNGRERHRAYKWMCSMLGQHSMEKAYRIYKELCAGKDLYCRYRQEIIYQNWMEYAVLLVCEE